MTRSLTFSLIGELHPAFKFMNAGSKFIYISEWDSDSSADTIRKSMDYVGIESVWHGENFAIAPVTAHLQKMALETGEILTGYDVMWFLNSLGLLISPVKRVGLSKAEKPNEYNNWIEVFEWMETNGVTAGFINGIDCMIVLEIG